MNMAKNDKIQKLLKLSLAIIAFLAMLVMGGLTSLAADSGSSAFYYDGTPSTKPVTINGLNYSTYYTLTNKSGQTENSSYGSSDGPKAIVDVDNYEGNLTAVFEIENPTSESKTIDEQFQLPAKVSIADTPTPFTLSSVNVKADTSGFTPASGYTQDPLINASDDDSQWASQADFNGDVSKVNALGIRGTIAAGGHYKISVPLTVNQDAVNTDLDKIPFFKIDDYSHYKDANNQDQYVDTSTLIRFAKKINDDGQFLAVTKKSDGSYTEASDIQSLMPKITPSGAVRYDNFEKYHADDVADPTASDFPKDVTDPEARFNLLDQTGFTGSFYYVDLTRLKDPTGAALMTTLKNDYGYTEANGANGEPHDIYNYSTRLAQPVVTGSDGSAILGKNGIGNIYLEFVPIPGFVKPSNGGGSGSNSDSSTPASATTPTTTTGSDTSSSSSSSQSSTTSTATTSSTGLPNYAAKQGMVVYATKAIYLYKTPNFKASQRIAKYPKQSRVNRPMFKVLDYTKSSTGVYRYKVKDLNKGSKSYGKTGYITASSSYVAEAYYQTVPASKHIQVIAKNGVNAYKSASLTGKVKHYKKGAHLTVKKVVTHNLTTRYELSNGTYITANKKLVIAD